MRIILSALFIALNAMFFLPFTSMAQTGFTDSEKRRALVPHIRSATDCVADAVRKNGKAMDEARLGNWSKALAMTDWPEICGDQLDKVAYWHDKYHGSGTGWDFLLGPYSKDLPRGIAGRLQLEIAVMQPENKKREKAEETLRAEKWYQDANAFMSDHAGFFKGDEVLIRAFDGVVRYVTADPINSSLSNRQQLQKAYDLLLSSIKNAEERYPPNTTAGAPPSHPPPIFAPRPALPVDQSYEPRRAAAPIPPLNARCNPMPFDPSGRTWPSVAAIIGPDRTTGAPSQLTIDNSRSTSNIYVKLAVVMGSSRQDIQNAYIPAGKQLMLRGIQSGTYVVKYKDIESGCNSVSEPFQIEQRETYNGIEYTDMTITIYKVSSGNFNFSNIPESDF